MKNIDTIQTFSTHPSLTTIHLGEDHSTEAVPAELLAAINSKVFYNNIRRLGQGGMGSIELAEDTKCLRKVAIKTLHKELVDDSEAILRFTEEAQIAAQLEHPNIIPIYDLAVNTTGEPYYTMKHIDGNDLSSILAKIKEQDKSFTQKYMITELIKILIKVCDAMSFACSKGALHRDLKPENIMIGEYGEVLIVDWGLAKIMEQQKQELTEPLDIEKFIAERNLVNTARSRGQVNLSMHNQLVGTPEFMPPERILGEANELSEVYSIGAILYSICSLELPYKEDDVHELLRRVSKGDYRDLGSYKMLPHFANNRVPESLIAITQKAIQSKAQNRYQSIAELRRDLEAYLQGYIPEAEDARLFKAFSLMIARHKKLSITIFTSLLILLFFNAVFIGQLLEQQKNAESESKAAIQLKEEAAQKTALVEQKATELKIKINELRQNAPILYEKAKSSAEQLNYKNALQTLNYVLELQPDLTQASL